MKKVKSKIYIYAYVNKSILKLNICVPLSVSVLLHYNSKLNVRCIPVDSIYKVYGIGRTWSWPVMSPRLVMYKFNPFLDHGRSQDTGSDGKKIAAIKDARRESSSLPGQSMN